MQESSQSAVEHVQEVQTLVCNVHRVLETCVPTELKEWLVHSSFGGTYDK
jgi:hypothetical protein